MTASSNFGNVFSVSVASAFIPFLPMLPMQLLVQNLLYDISQIAIPFDHVDEELLKKPQRWSRATSGGSWCFSGRSARSSTSDLCHDVVRLQRQHRGRQTLFQSGWFIVGLLTQTLIVHMIRTPKIPFLQSRAAAPLHGDDRSDDGHRHLPADGAACALLQVSSAAAAVLRVSCP